MASQIASAREAHNEKEPDRLDPALSATDVHRGDKTPVELFIDAAEQACTDLKRLPSNP
jgi:hypothetical protein